MAARATAGASTTCGSVRFLLRLYFGVSFLLFGGQDGIYFLILACTQAFHLAAHCLPVIAGSLTNFIGFCTISLGNFPETHRLFIGQSELPDHNFRIRATGTGTLLFTGAYFARRSLGH